MLIVFNIEYWWQFYSLSLSMLFCKLQNLICVILTNGRHVNYLILYSVRLRVPPGGC